MDKSLKIAIIISLNLLSVVICVCFTFLIQNAFGVSIMKSQIFNFTLSFYCGTACGYIGNKLKIKSN